MTSATRRTTRVQLELPEKSMTRLNLLKDRTEAASYAEVVKNAIRLYEAMIDKVEAGHVIFTRDPSGNETEYQVFA